VCVLLQAYATLPTLGGTNHHTGNIRWRLIVGDKKKGYKSSPRNGKPLIAMEIVRIWRNQSPPGRFLKLNEQTGLWDDVGDEDSRIKCLQALRERKESKLRLSNDRIGSTCLLPGDDSAPDDFGSGEAAELKLSCPLSEQEHNKDGGFRFCANQS
jgi:hypothetical protein